MNITPEWHEHTLCTAFDGDRRLACGPLKDVAAKAKERLDRRGETTRLSLFDDGSAQPIEVDFRGSVKAVLARLPKAPPATIEGDPAAVPSTGETRGRGRPRLGVIPREVTLLPRHWEWLNAQPGGASVALRKLVESARRQGLAADRTRLSQEAAYRFMTAMAGNRPGYEEATRALFAGKAAAFEQQTAGWPADVRDYARLLAQAALAVDP